MGGMCARVCVYFYVPAMVCVVVHQMGSQNGQKVQMLAETHVKEMNEHHTHTV